MALLPFSSHLIADVGISMGDEGKGRLIPEVVSELRGSNSTRSPVAMVFKVNGGANSGHTAGGIKLNLLPAGVVEPGIPLGIGSGVVADPRKFWWEIRPLEAKGHQIFNRLWIDERTMVSDLCHRLLDLAWEDYRIKIIGEEPRGSTGRGITPAYQDEAGQWQIPYSDFRGPREVFARKLAHRAERACRTIRHVCQVDEATWSSFFTKLTEAETRANREAIEAGIFLPDEFDFHRFQGAEPFTLNLSALTEAYWQAGYALSERVSDVRERVLAALAEGRYVIGEFGQAFWLDKRHGFSPNVTASHTYAAEFFNSAGIPVQPIHTFGVAKAYDTKVGTHTFLTQMEDAHPLAGLLKQLEFGTSTGRQRMVGWFDAVEKADALRYGGFHDLMINKIDALGHRGEWRGDLQICVAYEDPSGQRSWRVPRDENRRRRLRPVYERCAGWSEDISHARQFSDLPTAARLYTAKMVRSIVDAAWHDEKLPDALPNLRYLGVGPEPSQIIKDLPSLRDLLHLSTSGAAAS
jgi:adenylosuccinate synthase